MLTLEEFITAVTLESRVFVCVHDLSDITRIAPLSVGAARKLHLMPFCRSAKSLPGGLSTCMRTKTDAMRRAQLEKKTFVTVCPFGAASVVHPVVVEDRVLCILFASLLTQNPEDAKAAVRKTCAALHTDPAPLLQNTALLQQTSDFAGYARLLEAIDAYIRLLLRQHGAALPRYQPVVQEAVSLIGSRFHEDLSLTRCAARLHLHPKYLGRLFLQETGKSFHAYLNDVRLTNAKHLLTVSSASVIEIALSCGYNTVTYFNRVFKAATGKSPTQYRNRH